MEFDPGGSARSPTTSLISSPRRRPCFVVSAMGRTDELLTWPARCRRDRRAADGHADHRASGSRSPGGHGWPVGRRVRGYTGNQAGFVTDTNHTNARITSVPRRSDPCRGAPGVGRRRRQGVSTDNDVTFLGARRIDTTAVALAYALGADACELAHRRVRGVTTDPRSCRRRLPGCTASPSTRCSEMTAAGCPKPAVRSVSTPIATGPARPAPPSREGRAWVIERIPTWRALAHPGRAGRRQAKGHRDQGPGPTRRESRHAVRSHMAGADVNVKHDRAERVEGGVTDISFTVPHARSVTLRCAVRRRSGCGSGGDRPRDRKVQRDPAPGMKSNPGKACDRVYPVLTTGSASEMISTSAIGSLESP